MNLKTRLAKLEAEAAPPDSPLVIAADAVDLQQTVELARKQGRMVLILTDTDINL